MSGWPGVTGGQVVHLDGGGPQRLPGATDVDEEADVLGAAGAAQAAGIAGVALDLDHRSSSRVPGLNPAHSILHRKCRRTASGWRQGWRPVSAPAASVAVLAGVSVPSAGFCISVCASANPEAVAGHVGAGVERLQFGVAQWLRLLAGELLGRIDRRQRLGLEGEGAFSQQVRDRNLVEQQGATWTRASRTLPKGGVKLGSPAGGLEIPGTEWRGH